MNSVLSNIPLFTGLNSKQLAIFSGHIERRDYAANSVIISEGEKSDSLYILHSGLVKIYISGADGREMQLKILKPGDYFGELALIDQEPRSASAMTTCQSQLYNITSESFLQCLKKNQDMSLIMLKVLTKRLRDATTIQRQLALMGVYERLRVLLLTTTKGISGELRLEPKPTQQDIANMIGASREMVSRTLSDLRNRGYIEITKTSITIIKDLPEKL